MKNLIVSIVALCIGTGCLLGQSRFESDTMQYVSEEDLALKLHEEKDYLVKLNPLGFEHKIGDDFSLSAVTKSSGVVNDYFLTGNLNIGLEGRYYYQMKDRISAGLQASNLSGKYVAITPSAGIGINSLATNNTIRFGLAYGLSVAWAEQNRIFEYFYWDNGLELSYTRFDKDLFAENFSIITLFRKSEFGVVIGNNRKSKQDHSDMLPQVKVNINEKYALRIIDNNNYSISRITRGDLDDSYWELLAIPNIISELKIGQSPFSLVHDIRARIEFSNYDGGVKTDFQADRILYSLKMGTRWYYKMKSNVLAGKQGNNFTGGYVVANVAYHNSIDKDSNLTFVTGGWGYQKEVGKKFFINVDLTIAALVDGVRPSINLNEPTYLQGGSFSLNIGRRLF